MQQNKILTVITGLLLIFLNSCIEDYIPGDMYNHDGEISVSGWITDVPGRQVINLSVSTPLKVNIPNPLSGCFVEVTDDQGNTFEYQETQDGKYVHYFEEGDVQIGRSYKLRFVSPEGKNYESEYEKMYGSGPASPVHYEYDSEDTYNLGESLPGLRFYTDFDGENGGDETVYYKMEVWETYEFHTLFTEVYWMNNGVYGELPEDSLRPVCYITEKVSDIFLISTQNLEGKEISNYPLHFVSNETQRLYHGYSPELRILGLSEGAYTYWSNLKKIMEESGNIFETQPPASFSNINCLDDAEEEILGYFGASGVNSSRIFVPGRILESYNITPYCEPAVMPSYYMQRLQRMGQGYAFFVFYPDAMSGAMTLHIVTKSCFDCTSFDGSSTEKPDYWE